MSDFVCRCGYTEKYLPRPQKLLGLCARCGALYVTAEDGLLVLATEQDIASLPDDIRTLMAWAMRAAPLDSYAVEEFKHRLEDLRRKTDPTETAP